CEYGSVVPIDSSVCRPSYAKNHSAFDTPAQYKCRSDSGLGDYRFPRMNQRSLS
ncbi:hypothetical protein MKW92_047620, partial [Papaver armeniacum]